MDLVSKVAPPLTVALIVTVTGAGVDANFRLRDVQRDVASNAGKIQETENLAESAARDALALERRMSLVEQQIGFISTSIGEIRADQKEVLRRLP